MKVNSNLVQDIVTYYKNKLRSIYTESEAYSLLYTLIFQFFGFSKIDLVKQSNLRLNESEMLKIHFAIKDLINQKPIQYITGKLEFLDLELQIEAGVLIPRPETEQLVQLIIDDLKQKDTFYNIMDIGTGSGCIPLALKYYLNNISASGIDISASAIELARKNADLLSLDVKFERIDVFDESQINGIDMFDLIVSNPPYVKESEKQFMQKNVLDYEPDLALYVSDENPLKYYDRIAQIGRKILKDKGSLYFEINEFLGSEMIALLNKYNYQNIIVKKDFNNRDRFVSAFK